MVNLEQRQPFAHQFIFGSADCFLFEEDRADCLLGDGVVFLTKEFEGFNIEVFKSAGVDSSKVCTICTLPYGRVSAASDERSLARITDEGQQISFVFKKHNSAQ